MTMITRIGFCEKCFKEARPKTGNYFIAFGGKSNTFKGMIASHNGMKGFTPHIYQFDKTEGNVLYYSKICCMVGCGAYLKEQKDKKLIYLNEDLCEYEYTTIKNWNALVKFKNTGLKI